MLKVRIIPILTFNGFGLVKTKQFANPRTVGNPIQAAKVYNSRGVDELVFLDIFASSQSRKNNLSVIQKIGNECFMPVSVGGGIESIDDINDLLKIGADKVVIKSKALSDVNFIKEAVQYFGSQCISISIDTFKIEEVYYIKCNQTNLIKLEDFIQSMNECQVGEFLVNSVEQDGMMNGFDIELINKVDSITSIPIVAIGGGGNLNHFNELFLNTKIKAVGASSIFHFTQYTPLDIKNSLKGINIPVRIL
jgi:cyclase